MYCLDALKTVSQPARYLGNELGATPNKKTDLHGRLLHVALAFADSYEIAHSHLGHKILYGILNGRAGLSAERVYAPWLDMEHYLRSSKLPLTSLESKVPLKDFHVVGFSLQYELGYSNILNMLEMGGVSLLAADRGKDMPLIVAGGPGAANPEPLADFFDIFFLGDAEPYMLSDYELIKEWRFGGADKSELFSALLGRPGVYIPSYYAPYYGANSNGELCYKGTRPKGPAVPYPKRAVATSLDNCYFPEKQIVPFLKPVHDRVVVEIARGCSKGCRFCQAGYIYRPVRERSQDLILDLIGKNLEFTGQDEAAFLSLSAGDHSEITSLVTNFMDLYGDKGIALSLPSLRVRSINSELTRQIKRVRKTGFTIAPEAATERLRAVINKDLTDDDILRAADIAASLGWKTLKLYFMCGLPTETDDDLYAIGALAQRIRKLTKAKVNVGLAHLTPKAHTPFQWLAGSEVSEIQSRIRKVKEYCRIHGVTVKYTDPGASMVEGLLARGDRGLGRILLRLHKLGAHFQAWNEEFNLDSWLLAFKEEKLDISALLQEKDLLSPLPWDHIFYGVTKEYLKEEYQKALLGLSTQDCRTEGCLGCGACSDGAKITLAREKTGILFVKEEKDISPGTNPSEDTQNIAPLAQAEPAPGSSALRAKTQGEQTSGYRYLARFQKQGLSIFLGHLQLVEVFKRAFRRGGYSLSLSQGFHPSPKLSFLTALPLGVPSLDEFLIFNLKGDLAPEEIVLNLPSGLELLSIRRYPPGESKIVVTGQEWAISAPEPVFGRDLSPEALVSYTNAKGILKRYKLSDYVGQVTVLNPSQVRLSILTNPLGTPKPLDAARALWDIPLELALELEKIKTLLEL
ncbi:MAG: TIGR03960 family B12-binding radical SAM protein [Deltaproteobacteria bacterium]|nr:TIGR03960 family B12-binding radical SAM protein [Deltaproteobacteria bacterium]